MDMHSPFPGVDPFTEARHLWKGIHTQLIGELSTHQLPPLLAPAYYVDVEPSLQVYSETITVLPELEEEEEESAIFVREAGTERLVTVIEIVSYSNKTAGLTKRARYLAKRWEFLNSGIHLVEIDLLRWGNRVVPGLPDQAYHILVRRADEQPECRVWSFGFSEPIPSAALPLLDPGERVPLPLQEAFATIDAARNFRQRLDYETDPPPPLSEGQRKEIAQLLNRPLLTNGVRHNGHV